MSKLFRGLTKLGWAVAILALIATVIVGCGYLGQTVSPMIGIRSGDGFPMGTGWGLILLGYLLIATTKFRGRDDGIHLKSLAYRQYAVPFLISRLGILGTLILRPITTRVWGEQAVTPTTGSKMPFRFYAHILMVVGAILGLGVPLSYLFG